MPVITTTTTSVSGTPAPSADNGPCFMCAFDFNWAFPNTSDNATGLILVMAVIFLCCVFAVVITCLVMCKHHTSKKLKRKPLLERDEEVAASE